MENATRRKRDRMYSPLTHIEKLDRIGGGEKVKFAAKDWAIRVRLKWHDKARSAIRHILNGEQKLSGQDERDIDLGFMKHCAAQIERHRDEDRQLLETIRSTAEYLENADPQFHGPTLEALREIAHRLGGPNDQGGLSPGEAGVPPGDGGEG